MANEALKRYDESSGHGGVIQDFTCADGTGIEKGTVLKLSDPRTVAAVSSGEGNPIAGIAAREKVADDGRTRIPVYRKGDFDMYASGAITVGDSVISKGGDNEVCACNAVTTGASGAAIIGYALETASDGETIQVRVDL